MDVGLGHYIGFAALLAVPGQQFLLVEAGLVDHGGALVELGFFVLLVEELLNTIVGLYFADLDLEDLVVKLALGLLMDDIFEGVCPLSDPQNLLDLGHPAETSATLIANTAAYLLKASTVLLKRFEFEPRKVRFGLNYRPVFFGVVFFFFFVSCVVEQTGSVLLDGFWLFNEFLLILDDDYLPFINDFSFIVFIFACF